MSETHHHRVFRFGRVGGPGGSTGGFEMAAEGDLSLRLHVITWNMNSRLPSEGIPESLLMLSKDPENLGGLEGRSPSRSRARAEG